MRQGALCFMRDACFSDFSGKNRMINHASSARRIRWVDAAKGFAMLAIIVGHFSAFFCNSVEAAVVLFNFTDSFHVPLFFLLTGFTMGGTWMGARKCAKLAMSCFVPYIVAGIACILLCYTFCDGFDLYGRVFGFFYGAGAFRDTILWESSARVNAIGLLWFLPALFIGKVLASALTRFNVAVRACAACLLFLLGASTSSILFLPFDVQQGLCVCWYITCGSFVASSGILGRDGKEEGRSLRLARYIVLACGVLYAVVLCMNILEEPMYCNSNYHNVVIDMLGSTCCAITVMYVVKTVRERVSAKKTPLSWIGRNSMSVFVAHALTLACGDDTKWWLRSLVGLGFDPVACYVVSLGVNVAICLLFALATSKIGWLHRVVYGEVPVPFLSLFNGTRRKKQGKILPI